MGRKWPPNIGFMGLWDTVGAFGIPLNIILPFQKWNPGYKLGVPPNVTRCYHALALDERRESFTVTRLNAGGADPRIEERWFRGVHSDVGGGNKNLALSHITLKWMLQKAIEFNLPISARKLKALDKQIDPSAPISENLDPLPDPARTPLPTDLFHESAVGRTLKVDETAVFTVNAGEKFSWSGIRLVLGGRYTFDFASDQIWKDGKIRCGPAGWTVEGEKAKLSWIAERFIAHAEDDRRHPDALWFEVVGTLGNESDEASDMFRIGNGSKKAIPYVARRTDDLYCFANDLKSRYDNNEGAVKISVTRVG